MEIDQADLESYAEQQKYQIKLFDSNMKFQYNKNQKSRFEPFRSKDICEIYMKIIEKVVPLDDLKRQGILTLIFPVHDLNSFSDIDEKFAETSVVNIL